MKQRYLQCFPSSAPVWPWHDEAWQNPAYSATVSIFIFQAVVRHGETELPALSFVRLPPWNPKQFRCALPAGHTFFRASWLKWRVEFTSPGFVWTSRRVVEKSPGLVRRIPALSLRTYIYIRNLPFRKIVQTFIKDCFALVFRYFVHERWEREAFIVLVGRLFP